MRAISLVIPVYNERESLEKLQAEIRAVAQAHALDVQVIYVDDGSKDGSWDVIRSMAGPNVEGVRFRRNFGKAAALSAGFKRVRHPICLTLDADLQDDPAEIPNFLAQIDAGTDVVSGWKQKRYDPWHKTIPSKFFNGMVSRLTGVKLNDHNCGMKCYRREVLGEVKLYGELHRFIPVLAAARGFTVGELVIQHRPRTFGRSKYGFTRFVKGFLDLLTVKFLTSYGRRPQHFLGTLGLISFAGGLTSLAYLAVTWLIRYLDPDSAFAPLHARALPIYALAMLLLGAQMLGMGMLAEMITAFNGRPDDAYSVRETTDS